MQKFYFQAKKQKQKSPQTNKKTFVSFTFNSAVVCFLEYNAAFLFTHRLLIWWYGQLGPSWAKETRAIH